MVASPPVSPPNPCPINQRSALPAIASESGPSQACVSLKARPRSHSAGLLRSERQLLANPLVSDPDWFRKDDDVRWQPSGARSTASGRPQAERGGVLPFGVPPKGNANFAWVQHFIHHLAPHGIAGFVLANGGMTSNQPGDCSARSAFSTPKAKPQSLPRQSDIRRALIEADLVDCMVALPGQYFYSTQIPVCLWFLAKKKSADAERGFRDRRKQTVFIDALKKMGMLIDRARGYIQTLN